MNQQTSVREQIVEQLSDCGQVMANLIFKDSIGSVMASVENKSSIDKSGNITKSTLIEIKVDEGEGLRTIISELTIPTISR